MATKRTQRIEIRSLRARSESARQRHYRLSLQLIEGIAALRRETRDSRGRSAEVKKLLDQLYSHMSRFYQHAAECRELFSQREGGELRYTPQALLEAAQEREREEAARRASSTTPPARVRLAVSGSRRRP